MMPCVLADLALQDHLISSQLFVFLVVFVFVFLIRLIRILKELWARKKLSCFQGSSKEKFFVRDFCEVEFWEVLQM